MCFLQGKLVVCTLALLKLMDEHHYQRLIHVYKDQLPLRVSTTESLLSFSTCGLKKNFFQMFGPPATSPKIVVKRIEFPYLANVILGCPRKKLAVCNCAFSTRHATLVILPNQRVVQLKSESNTVSVFFLIINFKRHFGINFSCAVLNTVNAINFIVMLCWCILYRFCEEALTVAAH
jgi:hypothetical protein